MAANLGQAILGAAGIVPTLAQELASGHFHENRETFHDYIYSKLILGDNKGINPNISSSNSPVFPNTNLASSYPSALQIISSPYSQSSSNGNHRVLDSVAGGTFDTISLSKALKSGSVKKKSVPAPQNTIQLVCPEIGEDLTKLKKKSHHKKKDKTNVCDVCGRGFAEKYTLNRHMMTHTHVKPYSCTKCNMSFSRSDGLAKHMAAGYRCIDAHHCDICGGTFNSEVSFEQHRREYGNTLPFVCNLCMLAFSQCCHLNYHMKSHSLSKINDVAASNGVDDKNKAIDVSELIPDDFSPPKKEAPKNSVGFVFLPTKTGDVPVGKGVDNHTQNSIDSNIDVKSEVVDYHTCQPLANQITRGSSAQLPSLVNTSFEVLNNFPAVTSSAAAHEMENPHVNHSGINLTSANSAPSTSYLPDTTAGLSSATPSAAVSISDIDMKKYLDIKVPTPRFIDGSILQGTNFNEDSLFRCEICGKGFTRKYHMQRHVKLHIRGPVPKAHVLDWTRRPYACGVCKMGFTRQHHLTRHMLIHTGERPHSCHVCGKAFRRFTNLTLHVRTVHGAERPFKCHICGRGFPRLYSLQRHLKLHAKNAAEATTVDELYKEFKTVGTASLEQGKSPSYTSFNPGSSEQSPDDSRESMSSEQSDGSETFEQRLGVVRDGVGHIDASGSSSPITYRDRYSLLQEKNQNSYFSQGDLLSHKDQVLNSNQTGERLIKHDQGRQQQAMLVKESDRAQTGERLIKHDQGRQQQSVLVQDSDRAQSGRILSSSNDNPLTQKSLQARIPQELSPSTRPSSEPLGSPSPNNVTRTDITHQSSLQNISSGRFTPSNSTQNMRSIDMTVSRSLNHVNIREANKFSLNQIVGSDEGFALHQQSTPSPHTSISSLELPGSLSMLNPTSSLNAYHQSQIAYKQALSSLLTQKHANLDLSVGRCTMSPVHLHDPTTYSHNRHGDIAGNGSVINEPPAYSHNRSVNILPFASSAHGLYQQQLSDSMNHLDMHPNPSASPMPVNPLSSSIQY